MASGQPRPSVPAIEGWAMAMERLAASAAY